jgi:hypothetical protein
MIKDAEFFLNHPLITGDENKMWTEYRTREYGENSHGGCIDVYPDCISESKKGLDFIIKVLNEYKPKRILEIGTNIGSFGIIVQELLPNTEIYTCDVTDFSPRVNQINKYFGNENIKFARIDSTEFSFKSWIRLYKFDMAWVDANHSLDYVKNDIKICIDMKIPYILLDDCSEKDINDVNIARKTFKEIEEIDHSDSLYLGAISLNKLKI